MSWAEQQRTDPTFSCHGFSLSSFFPHGILQVLISIQSMILVPDPFFNEPGYESMKTSNSGMYSSEVYNAKIRESTVRFAMLNHLISPSPTFRSVIETHFRLKADVIAEQLEEWKAKAGIAQQRKIFGG